MHSSSTTFRILGLFHCTASNLWRDSENDLWAGLELGLSVDFYSLNALSAFQFISEFQKTLRKSLFIVIVEVGPSDLERYGMERSSRSRESAHPCERINSHSRSVAITG